MAVKDIRRESVEKALDEFRSTGRQDMLEEYGGGTIHCILHRS